MESFLLDKWNILCYIKMVREKEIEMKKLLKPLGVLVLLAFYTALVAVLFLGLVHVKYYLLSVCFFLLLRSTFPYFTEYDTYDGIEFAIGMVLGLIVGICTHSFTLGLNVLCGACMAGLLIHAVGILFIMAVCLIMKKDMLAFAKTGSQKVIDKDKDDLLIELIAHHLPYSVVSLAMKIMKED